MSKFYYKLLPNGDKNYYNSTTGKSVRKRSIPAEIRDSVQLYDSNIHITFDSYQAMRNRRRENFNNLTEELRRLIIQLELKFRFECSSAALRSWKMIRNVLKR